MRGAHRVLLGAAVVALVAAWPAAAQDATGPEARLSISPLDGVPGTEFRADAHFSRGSLLDDGSRSPLVRYQWDWSGTGAFAEGAGRERHVYEDAGRYMVGLRVTDATGATATAFRNVTVGQPQSGFRWDVVWDNAGLFWKGAQVTLLVSVIAIVGGFPLGLVVGLARISRIPPLRWAAAAYIEFLRGTPLLVQIFIVVFGLPELGIGLGAFRGAIVALLINTSAYQAEIVRSGIQAIPSGQTEAALALGMTYGQTMRDVILPQALRLVIPPLTNEFIILVKDSSIVSLIGVLELMGYARVIGNRTFRLFEPFIAVACIYFVITYSLSLLLQWAERRLAIPGLGVQKVAH